MYTRLLCCTDTHGRPLPLVEEAGCLAWLHAGDVCSGWDRSALQSDSRREAGEPVWESQVDAAIEAWFETRTVPVFLVRGSHDFSDPYGAFSRCHDVTGTVVAINEHLVLAGIGWHGKYHFDLPREEDLEVVCDQVRRHILVRLRSKKLLILLTHYPAALEDGANDCTSRVVRRLVDDLRPIMVVQGHEHGFFGTDHTLRHPDGRRSLIVNPGPGGAELLAGADDAAVVRYFATA